MEMDRRELLLGLAATTAMLSLPRDAVALAAAECFAAARKDDRGTYSAAMFSLNGDLKSVELPGRGHDIALRPDGGEWVAFAPSGQVRRRRADRIARAEMVQLEARPPLLRSWRVLARRQTSLRDGE